LCLCTGPVVRKQHVNIEVSIGCGPHTAFRHSFMLLQIKTYSFITSTHAMPENLLEVEFDIVIHFAA